ncbi:MAG TPA: monofunctional biosynthetic peptidoglycan transglycosylase, partial [Nitrospiria bacterium]|nr:monofunctional biosynthetic peptidoglycan transglycosylase [Nitrospiria bacterium]
VAIAWVPLPRIAPVLRRAVVIAEDANFYHHKGIDWEATWSAMQRDWRQHRFSHGGSTITQQLAKNLYLEPRKTIWRKATEALIALRMERHLSKARLLELYLNVVEWGRGVYGAEAAAQHYFGKPASELTIDEAAWMAAILPSPLRYEVHPRARPVVSRASTIRGYLERQLSEQAPPIAPPELPPLPPDEEEEPATSPSDTALPPTLSSPSAASSINADEPQPTPVEPGSPAVESAPPQQRAPMY